MAGCKNHPQQITLQKGTKYMNDLNKIFLMGNLTKDPYFRDFGKGNGGVCTLRIASNRDFISNGQKQTETLFVEVNVYGKPASTCRQFLSKGSKVLVEGRLVLKQWEKEGKQYSKLMIAAENVQFMPSANSREHGEENGSSHRSRRSVSPRPVDSSYAPQMPPPPDDGIPDNAIPEEDIPF
jgi:single-strand DNA-binding protein